MRYAAGPLTARDQVSTIPRMFQIDGDVKFKKRCGFSKTRQGTCCNAF